MNINELYQRSIDGRPESEKQLFESLTARFRVFARQRIYNDADAEEVVQEAMVTVCREYRRMEVETSFAAWAYKVLDNRILACLSAKKRREDREISIEQGRDISGPVSEAAPSALKTRLLGCLKKVGGVNRRYARVLNFSYQGYRVDEICRRMELKANTLYSLLSRARKMLESCLETGDIKQ